MTLTKTFSSFFVCTFITSPLKKRFRCTLCLNSSMFFFIVSAILVIRTSCCPYIFRRGEQLQEPSVTYLNCWKFNFYVVDCLQAGLLSSSSYKFITSMRVAGVGILGNHIFIYDPTKNYNNETY